jgi:selenocysteine-specific elongation factor
VERVAGFERMGPDVALAGHRVELGDDQVERWQQAVSRLGRSLAVPDERDLGIDPELIHLKVRDGELVRIAPGLVYLPDQIAELTTHLEDLGDSFTVAEFRDASGLSRKYAVPFLEWSDRVGLTVRRGDARSLR